MQGSIEFILSDWGWLIAVVIGVILLSVIAWGALISKGFMTQTKTYTGSSTTIRFKRMFGPQSWLLFMLGGIVMMLVAWGGLSLWNQIVTAPPYIGEATYNFVFISMLVVLLVSMFTMALALMRLLGGLERARRIFARMGG